MYIYLFIFYFFHYLTQPNSQLHHANSVEARSERLDRELQTLQEASSSETHRELHFEGLCLSNGDDGQSSPTRNDHR